MSYYFWGKVKEQKLVLGQQSKKTFKQFLEKNNGKDVEFTGKRYSPNRSLDQNALYWGHILTTISEHTGHYPEELDDVFESMFAPKKMIKYRGKEIAIPKHCRELTKIEFGEYLDRINAEVSDLGISLLNESFTNVSA